MIAISIRIEKKRSQVSGQIGEAGRESDVCGGRGMVNPVFQVYNLPVCLPSAYTQRPLGRRINHPFRIRLTTTKYDMWTQSTRKRGGGGGGGSDDEPWFLFIRRNGGNRTPSGRFADVNWGSRPFDEGDRKRGFGDTKRWEYEKTK